MSGPYQAHGNQVMRDGEHIADAGTPAIAVLIAVALNRQLKEASNA